MKDQTATGRTAATSQAVGGATSATTKPARVSGAAAQQQQAQRELEEQQRLEQGRQSRHAFLANPLNVFQPYLWKPSSGAQSRAGSAATATSGGREGVASRSGRNQTHDTHSATHRRENSKSSTNCGNGDGTDATGSRNHPQVVLEDSAETNFAHARPLSPSQYSVKLLPLRDFEWSPALASSAGTDVGDGEQQQPQRHQTGSSKGKVDRDSFNSPVTGKADSRVSRSLSTTAPGSKSGGGGTGASLRLGREKQLTGSAAAAAASSPLCAADGILTLTSLDHQQQETARRTSEAFDTLVRAPVARLVSASNTGAAEEWQKLRDCRALFHSATMSYWEKQTEMKRSAAVAHAAAAFPPSADSVA